MAVTIYDVARSAGLSIKTVSRVMNGLPVSAASRARVKVAAAELNYHPSLQARTLAGGRSALIVVLCDAGLTIEHWNSQGGANYLPQVQLGATLSGREAGYYVLFELIGQESPQLKQDITTLLSTLKPAGVVLTPPSSDNPTVLQTLDDSGVPYVRLEPESQWAGGMSMLLDNEGAAERMTRYLIGLGHRRIGFVMGDPRHGTSHARLRGYQAGLRSLGVRSEQRWIAPAAYTFESGYEAGQQLLALDEGISAIFASSDLMARGVIAAAQDAGLSVPQDLSVAGFDDAPCARAQRPALTTIRQPLTELAAEAVRWVVAPEQAGDCKQSFGFFQLIERDSTAGLWSASRARA